MKNIEFSEWLDDLRKKAGFSKAKLARLAGLSESQIGRVISGEQGVSVDSTVKMARGLGVSPIEMFCRVARIEPIEKNPEYIKLAGYYDRLDENRRKDLLFMAENYFNASKEK